MRGKSELDCPPPCAFVGVRLDDMAVAGMDFVLWEEKGGGKILMHHRFLPLSLVPFINISRLYLLKDIISSPR